MIAVLTLNGVWRVAAYGEPVGTGATSPHYASIEGVVKMNTVRTPHVVANEFICGRLALMLGLPVPPGVIVGGDTTELGYLSLRFGPARESPPPINARALQEDHPDLPAGIVLFDTWIANPDRHERNMAYIRGVMDPVVFDHSHALLGTTGGVKALASLPTEKIFVRPPLLDVIDDGGPLTVWKERIGDVPPHVIENICDQVARAGALTEAEADEVSHLLDRRRIEIVDGGVVGALQDRLPNVTEAGLT